MAGVIRRDLFFTIPSVVAIIAGGVGLASMAGLPLLGTPWIAAWLAAFGLSGACSSRPSRRCRGAC